MVIETLWMYYYANYKATQVHVVHYNGIIMGAMASQITSLTIVYSAVYPAADQRKHQSSASLAFVRETHRSPVNAPHQWPVMWKMFPFDDVIMCMWSISTLKVPWCLARFHIAAISSHVVWKHIQTCWWQNISKLSQQRAGQKFEIYSAYRYIAEHQMIMDIGTLWHCALVSCTPSQYIGLVLGCALVWCLVSLCAPFTISLIELYFIMIFIMRVVTIIGIFMAIVIILNCMFRLIVTK